MTEDTVLLNNADEWRLWLTANCATRPGVWLKIAKKNSSASSITISEALDVALCFGWIDSQRKALDLDFYIQRYSPRSARSPWSQLNKDRAEQLIKAGLMMPPGVNAIALAKQDGRWNAAYQSQKNFELPENLLGTFRKNSALEARFHEIDKTAQYLLVLPLLKVTSAKEEKRELMKIVEKLTEAAEN